MTVAELLPGWNALLNATAAVLLFLGVRAIRAGERERHRRLMISAVAVSALFLASYLTRFWLTREHPYPGTGPLKWIYYAILLSHVLLAVLVPPLALRSLFLGLKGRFEEHKAAVRWAYPIWLYVSVTGVLVYALLYQVAPRVG
jgi:putative membrane protein